MQLTQNPPQKDPMKYSMLAKQEKVLKSPPKKTFSPLRPFCPSYLLKKQNLMPKQKICNSFENNKSAKNLLHAPIDPSTSSYNASSANKELQFFEKHPCEKIKLSNIKEMDKKDRLKMMQGKFFSSQKKMMFQKTHINSTNDLLTKELEAVINTKSVIKQSPRKESLTRIAIPSKPKEFKVLMINNKRQVFEMIKFLDKGSYGKVYLVLHTVTKVLYCLKAIEKCQLNEQSFNQLVRQTIIQSFLNHPNIVNLYSFTSDAQYVYLILQACPGQNLYKRLSKHPFKQKDVRKYIKEVCVAVEYMHKNDIIHRDIKPENIILHENTVKICDFGWAVHSPLLRNTQCGTPLYTPPEMVKYEYYDSKIDIWCIGVLTYELLFGTIPFEIRHPNDLSKIISEEVYFSKEISITDSAKHFIKKCLQKDAADRYNIRQALQDDFLVNKIDTYRHTLS